MPTNPETPVIESRGGFQRALGWLFVGAGFVSLGASGYFGAHWLQERDSNDASTQKDASTQRDTAEAALGIAGAALFVGTVLVTTAPGPRVVVRHDARIDVVPVVSAGQGGLVVRGGW
jgi:hypothetical protein